MEANIESSAMHGVRRRTGAQTVLTFQLELPTLTHFASTHSLSFEQVAAGTPRRP
jgi:hypothetical protein